MARTLKMPDTLPGTIRASQHDIEAQQKAINQVEQSYEARLECHRIKVQKKVDKKFDTFGGRPYLATAQLAALMLHMSYQSNQLIAKLAVIFSLVLFIACFKPLSKPRTLPAITTPTRRAGSGSLRTTTAFTSMNSQPINSIN